MNSHDKQQALTRVYDNLVPDLIPKTSSVKYYLSRFFIPALIVFPAISYKYQGRCYSKTVAGKAGKAGRTREIYLQKRKDFSRFVGKACT